MIEKLVQILNQLISMKKFFLIIISFLIFNNLQAGYGSGDLKLTDQPVYAFHDYLKGNNCTSINSSFQYQNCI